MPRVSNNVILSADLRRLHKGNKSFYIDIEQPCIIASAAVECGLTTKETSNLFLFIATNEPYPKWADATN